MRVRHLRGPAGQSYETTQQEETVTLVSGVAGKTRTTSKSFATPLEAIRFCEKEELSRLRKGFLGHHPHEFQVFLSKGFTGAMVVDFHHDRIVTNAYSDETQSDHLLHFDFAGQLQQRTEMPAHRLVWEIDSLGSQAVLLLDHQICLADGAAVTPPNLTPASFLSLQAGRLACYQEPELVVRDAQLQPLFRRFQQPDKYSGHSPQMAGALSPDGTQLAACSQTGTIDLYQLESGQQFTLPVAPSLIQRLAFSHCGRYLFLAESYKHWRLSRLDLKSGNQLPLFETQHARDFALHPQRPQIAVPQGATAHLLDYQGVTQATVSLDHVVKRARLALHGDYLAARSDSGCLTLTRIQPL